MTFISIITPFRKGKRYLKDCLDGLAEQNLEDTEIILILNGITEDVDDLIAGYTGLNLIVKNYPEELGPSRARNEGLDIAGGKYVYFLDGDDYHYGGGLDMLSEAARKSDADFINGERINTAFIRERFDEQLQKKNRQPLKKGKLSDMEYSLKLLVGDKTNSNEVLSVLHALIKRDIIGNTRFIEDKRYHADYDFMMEIFDGLDTFIGVEDALYAKRTSDDPIKLTSLNQEKKKDSFLIYCDEYNRVLNSIKSKPDEKYRLLKRAMADKFRKSYFSDFANKFYASPNKKWRGKYFDAMSDISKDFTLDNLSWKDKKEIQALQKKDKKTLRRFIKVRRIYRKIKAIKKDPWKFDHTLYTKFYNKRPINENQIFIESFRGDFYTDSPKYIYEYLMKHYGDKYECVWVKNNSETVIPGNPKTVKRFTRDYYKAVAQSKYWLINTRQPGRLKKRKGQVIVSTWHGTPLKRLGFDQENIHMDNPRSKSAYRKDSKQWDYLISPNRFTTNVLRSSFAYDGKVLETGYPRNDILYNATESDVAQIKRNLNIPLDKKIILYAPTWRDDESFDVGKVKFELKLDLAKLKEALGDEYIILVRTHYFIANRLDLSDVEGFAYDVSRYDDIAELYLISDMLITDYSSVFFDFANLRRPILYYTYDLDKYENVLRGFYIDIRSEVPGPLLYTTEEVIDAVENIDDITEKYSEKYDEFYDRFCYIEDGNASKRIVEEIWGE